MAGTTNLARDFSKRFGLTQKDSRIAIEYICNDIVERLGKGETVNVRNFGVFKAKNLEARTIRNPQTQETAEAPATVRVLFTASKAMKTTIKKDRGLPLTEAEVAYLEKGGDAEPSDDGADAVVD